VDLPAVLALAVFRPKINWPKLRSVKAVILEMMGPMPSPVRLAAVFCVGLVLVAVSTAVLALNPPARATASYEVLEPQSWVGKKLPILDYIDIGDKVSSGNWLVLFYHHDCPDCAEAIRSYEQMAFNLRGRADFLRIAFIEVPPYGPAFSAASSACAWGRLSSVRQWFVSTPAAVLLRDKKVESAWEAQVPDIAAVIASQAKNFQKIPKKL